MDDDNVVTVEFTRPVDLPHLLFLLGFVDVSLGLEFEQPSQKLAFLILRKQLHSSKLTFSLRSLAFRLSTLIC
jgi:hypothetical protein